MDTNKLAIPFLSAIWSFSESQGKMTVSHQLLPCILLDSVYKTSSKCTFSHSRQSSKSAWIKVVLYSHDCLDSTAFKKPKHIHTTGCLGISFHLSLNNKKSSLKHFTFSEPLVILLKRVKKQLSEEKFQRFHTATLTCTGQTVLVNQSLATPRHMPELRVTDKAHFHKFWCNSQASSVPVKQHYY